MATPIKKSKAFQVWWWRVTCVALGAARGWGLGRRTRKSTQLGGAGSERARELGVVAEQNFRAGEERETLKGSGFAGGAGLWMGTTRAALPRGGARATLEEDEDDDEGARRDGEGGGRRRWEGAAAAVAGDGALRRR